MNILISAFDCNPNIGSDSYVGWSYMLNMAKINQVIVLTNEENRNDIENYRRQHDVDGVRFEYISKNKRIFRIVGKFNEQMGVLAAYMLWQKSAYRKAKIILQKEKVDICHHISIADFRVVGHLWKLNVPFIFGPVGGAQETPNCLKCYVSNHKFSEIFRLIINKTVVHFRSYKMALKKAAKIYCSNDETMDVIVKILNGIDVDKVQQLTELCVEENYLTERWEVLKRNSPDIHILVAGRLMNRKGIELLLDAVERLNIKTPFIVDVCGEGPQRAMLERKVRKSGLEKKVIFHGKVNFHDMQKIYQDSDIFVLPSLRETTGTALIEAMANKLPVIALNQCGAKHLVGDKAGILVDVRKREQVILDMANAMKMLIENEHIRSSLGLNGYNIIRNRYTWTKRVEYMNDVYREVISNAKV